MNSTEQLKPFSDAEVAAMRRDFPILSEHVHGKPLVYLDNGATGQKPKQVIDAIARYYSRENSNIHRGVHYLSAQATIAYENARKKIQKLIHAPSDNEIIFLRGTTEAINLVAQSYGRTYIQRDDEVLISAMEHHANIVPWQMLCEQTGAKLRVIPMNERGELRMDAYQTMLTEKTKIVAIVHVSNSLGTINPVKEMIALAHAKNIPVIVDGAQAVQHMPVDVKDLDCDFYAFSGHKMFGPTGVGILYGKKKWLDAMPPYQGGGDMIRSVTFEKTTYNDVPHKFEAGTPHIAGGIALGDTVDYLQGIGLERIAAYEKVLLDYATEKLSAVSGLHIIGTAHNKAGVISFILDGVHPHDVGTMLDQEGIAIRTGHHCTQPVMQFFKVPATSRVSLAFYNTHDEIDTLVKAIHKTMEMFR
ncbi:MAG TPA: cysteine desulfurase [bacterium]|nr:cysteine desulfurase [bacterium]HND77229.1 cysteine desulfurase [bacterium]HNH30034.1 cysteine desulfurase [bacterium]HNH33594.1 cysteine desulfurase [bacterium]HNO91462.1 cysteine desulfurase [bacterium]